ncbi:MAG TPA: phosphoribosylglycinamide synthetase C domain-containing protein, partial [Verrucomicrobiae bacterium]|nr:phosphoribosylglycinamide synthetase C domain-containing protein [Verrucomicrobiae bacterium]
GSYAKGKPIHGLEAAEQLPNVKVFHAGTGLGAANEIITTGGRVLGVTAWGAELAKARERAYAAVDRIQFEGALFRRDIAVKALNAATPATPRA